MFFCPYAADVSECPVLQRVVLNHDDSMFPNTFLAAKVDGARSKLFVGFGTTPRISDISLQMVSSPLRL